MEKPPVFMGTADKKFTKRQIEWFWQQDAKVQRNAKRIAKWVPPLKKNNEEFDAIMTKYDREYNKLGLTDRPLDTLSKNERNKLLAMNLRQLYLLQKQMKPLRSAYKYATRMSDAKEKMTLQFDQTRKSLNKMIRQSGELLPLWVGLPGEYPPERCCRIPSNDKPKRGELAPAYVNDMWILAEVMSVDEESNTVVVRDIDEDGGMFRVYSEQVILLPKYRLDPLRYPDAIFPVDAVVYGLYPQTTCFYKGIVSNPPLKDTDDYFVTFEDEEYDGLFAPEVRVPQRFIVPFKEVPKKTLCESVKELEDNDVVEEFKINDIIDQEDRYGLSKATKRRLPEALREKTPEVVELSSSEDEDVVMEPVDESGKQKDVADSDVILLTDSEAGAEAVPKVVEVDSDVNMEVEPATSTDAAPSVAEVQPEKVTVTIADVSMDDVFETNSEATSSVSSKASSVLSTHVRSNAESVSQGTSRASSHATSEASSVATVVQPSNANTSVVSNINMDDVFETSSDAASRGDSRVASVASLKAPSTVSSTMASVANVAAASVVSSRASSVVHSEAASNVTVADSDVIILSDSETVTKATSSVPEAVSTTNDDASKKSSRAASDASTEAESNTDKNATPEVITLSDSEESVAESDVIEVESDDSIYGHFFSSPPRTAVPPMYVDASLQEHEVASEAQPLDASMQEVEVASEAQPLDASMQEVEVASEAQPQSYVASREPSHEERGSTLSVEKSSTPEQQLVEEQAASEEASSAGSQSRKSSSASEAAEDRSQSVSSQKTLSEEPQDDTASVQFLYEAPGPVYYFPLPVPAPAEPDNLGYLFDDAMDDGPLVFNRDQQRDVDVLIKMKARDPSLLPEEVMQGIENLNFKHRIDYDGAARTAPSATVVEKEIPDDEALDEEDEDYEYDEEEEYQDNYDDQEDSYISEDEVEIEEDIEGGEELEEDGHGELERDSGKGDAANDEETAMDVSDDERQENAEKESTQDQQGSTPSVIVVSTASSSRKPSHDQYDTEHHSDARSTVSRSEHQNESKTESRQSSRSKESSKYSSEKEASHSGRESSTSPNLERDNNPSKDEMMETEDGHEDADDNEDGDEAEDEEESEVSIKDYHTDCSESSTDVPSESDDDDIPEAPYDSDEVVELSNGSDDYDSEYDEEQAESPNPPDSGNKMTEEEFETPISVEEDEVMELSREVSVITVESSEQEAESVRSEERLSEQEPMSDDRMSDQHSPRSERESSHASTLVADRNSRTPEAEAATDESIVIRTPTPQSQRMSTLTPEPTEEWPETETPQLLETSPSQSPAATPQPQTSTETPPVLTPAQSPPIDKTPETQTTPIGSPFRIDQTGYSYILEPPPPPPLLLPFASGQSSYIVPPPPPPPPLEDYNPEDRRSVPMDVDTPSPGPSNPNPDRYNFNK